MKIAQSAFAFFDIRLNQIARIARFTMAFVTFFHLGFDELRPCTLNNITVVTRFHIIKKLAVTAQKAGLQNGGSNGEILFRKPHTFINVAGGMAHFKIHIPKHVENIFNDALTPRGLLIRKQE